MPAVFFLFFGSSCSLQLKNGAYEDLVIGVTDSVPATDCKKLLENLEVSRQSDYVSRLG